MLRGSAPGKGSAFNESCGANLLELRPARHMCMVVTLLRRIRAHWLMLTGFAVLAVVGWQTADVWTQNREILDALQRTRAGTVQEGDEIDYVVGTTVRGERARYKVAGFGNGTLLIALSVDCGFCDRNVDPWHRLSAHARAAGLQVIWVSRDTLERLQGNELLDASLVVEPTHSTHQQLKLSTVPQTVIVGNNGIVTATHTGVIDSASEPRIADALRAVARIER